MDKKPLTVSAGIPVGDSRNSLTAGPCGPLLVQDWQLSFRRRPWPVLRMQGSSPKRGDPTIPIQPESGPFARRGRVPGPAKGIVARSRKAIFYNQLDRIIECKQRKERTHVNRSKSTVS